MLTEVRVAELGLFTDLTLVLGPGLTALTGETGAGKTLVVDAIELLLGSRADPVLVRPGAEQASVEGRFAGEGEAGDDLILARACRPRVQPGLCRRAHGAARGSRRGRRPTGRPARPARRAVPVVASGATGGRRPLRPDRPPGGDRGQAGCPARRESLADLGGDIRVRAREIDLLRFQIGELDEANLADPDEDRVLAEAEDRFSAVAAHQDAAAAALTP